METNPTIIRTRDGHTVKTLNGLVLESTTPAYTPGETYNPSAYMVGRRIDDVTHYMEAARKAAWRPGHTRRRKVAEPQPDTSELDTALTYSIMLDTNPIETE